MAGGRASSLALAQLRRRRFAFAGALFVALLAFVACFADVLASDLPLACRVQGNLYLLPAVTRPPSLRGWDNDRVIEATRASGWAILPLVRHGPLEAHGAPVLAPPSPAAGHPLGTDAFGRDVFARVVHGARTSLALALVSVVAFVGVGAFVGALAGFFGGLVDALVARLVETLSAFPTIVLVLVVQALSPRPRLLNFLLAIALTRWPEVARLVRAEVLLVASQEYALAARALGASPWRVLVRHVMPNVKAPIVVASTFGIASVVLIEASLSFLGVGVPQALPSWGEMLSEARPDVHGGWLLVIPGLLVFLLVGSLNLVGEALRDLLDPRLRIESLHPAMRPGGPSAASALPASTEAAPSTGTPP